MRRYDPGEPVALRYTAVDDNDAPVGVTGTLIITKPDLTTYNGVVQSGGTGILDVIVPAAEASQLGRYGYAWAISGGVNDSETGRFYVGAIDDEMPPLASLALLARKIGYTPVDSERERAEHLLDEASELIRDVAGKTWLDSVGALDSVPRRVARICVAVAYRAFGNPEALTQRSIGDSSKSYDRSGLDGGEDVYLTPGEEDSIKKAAGSGSFVSMTLVSPYSADNLDTEVLW